MPDLLPAAIVPGAEGIAAAPKQERLLVAEKQRAESIEKERLAEAQRQREQEEQEERDIRARLASEEPPELPGEEFKIEAPSRRKTSLWHVVIICAATLLIAYLTMVLPLQRRIDRLTATVDHDAEVGNKNTDVVKRTVASLASTVDENARVANRNTDSINRRLDGVAGIAENANRFAHSHNRF